MKKILLPTLDYPPRTGGVARYLEAMKKTLGDDMDVLFFEESPSRFALMWQLWRRSRLYNQVWTSHVLPIGTMLWLLSSVYKLQPTSYQLRYSVFLHGMDFDLARRSRWKRWLTRHILQRAQFVFANTKALQTEVSSFSGRAVEVVYPCVSDALVESSSVMRREKHERITLLTVGRLVERKGHMAVLDIVRRHPELSYIIVGDGVLRGEILSFIEEYDLKNRVEVIQGLPDRKLPSMYLQADVFVMPTTKSESDREGFGIVYLESQLFGTPVIATRHPGVDEAIVDGVGGVLIDDVSQLEQTIMDLAHDNRRREDMGKRGQIFVKERFTREKQFGVLRAYV